VRTVPTNASCKGATLIDVPLFTDSSLMIASEIALRSALAIDTEMFAFSRPIMRRK
jgi:hypothetical protein